MSAEIESLDEMRVASPCPADWNVMQGDDRKRFCQHCQLNVYNLSAMTPDEARQFVNAAEGRVCGRFFRRADGTVLTAGCPIGDAFAATWACTLGKRRHLLLARALWHVSRVAFPALAALGLITFASDDLRALFLGAGEPIPPDVAIKMDESLVPAPPSPGQSPEEYVAQHRRGLNRSDRVRIADEPFAARYVMGMIRRSPAR